MNLVELFERGGVIMWPILVASIVGVAFFIDRLIALRRSAVLPPDTFHALVQHLGAGDFTRAAQLCRESSSRLGRIALAGLDHRQDGRQVAREAMEESGRVALGSLEAGVGGMSTVAAIAPLLGLLGTVTGMIKVFRDVAGAANPDISLLARGIWEALITTGAGLTVAIPIYVAYRFIESRIDRCGRELEAASLELLDLMDRAAAPASAPPSAPAELPADAEEA